MKNYQTPFLILTLIFCTNFSFGQNFKTEVKMIDSSNASVNARLFITEINKNNYDELLLKIKNTNLFTSNNEFFAEKSTANFHLKSNSKFSLKDFELFLKQLEVYSVVYKNKSISSQELAANYVHYNSTEIKKIERIK